MRFAPAVRATVLALVLTGGSARAQPTSAACALHGPEATATKASCLACHRPGGGANAPSREHPVDLDYGAVAARRPNDLRPAAEVVKRGVRLPDGALRCATCHDGDSPYDAYIALPHGAPAVAPWSPALEGEDGTAPPEAAAAGQPVSAKPLCLACHVYD